MIWVVVVFSEIEITPFSEVLQILKNKIKKRMLIFFIFMY